MSQLYNEWILIPLVAVLSYITVYYSADRVISNIKNRALGKREEIIKLLRLMGSETDEKKVTLAMLALSFGPGILCFLLFYPKVIPGLIFGTALTLVGFNLPYLVIKRLYEKRCDLFVDQMVDGLTIMANGIKSGTNVMQAMQKVTEIMRGPIRAEFSQVISQHQFGQSLEDALTDLAERIPRPDVQMFVIAINILKETGGNLGETFETIVRVVRERQKIEKKIQAMTAQGIAQGVIMSLIPFIIGVIMYALDPGLVAPFYNSTFGLILLFIVIALVTIAGLMIKKIVTIKV
ncbi:MAG: type II secretion system F family protein [Bdellovibrionaceae bacterium]|nr:type II secretion system F family protein [Pseudobdellovibrionaceae bacterium]